MSFSPQWLALREPADHRARDAELASQLGGYFVDTTPIQVIDLGAGTGSNLRATAPLLGAHQEWTLVDFDPTLLEEAAFALTAWADEARAVGDDLVLAKGDKTIGVRFRIANLNVEIEDILAKKPDLVTASALFDLISPAWMTRFAAALAASGAAFYTVLTYNGRDTFRPPHPFDFAVMKAFGQHQKRDKGFGPAAGPDAPEALAAALRGVGYSVETAESPWVLKPSDAPLVLELLSGIARAVAETGLVAANGLSDWLDWRQSVTKDKGSRFITGHTDIFARKA